MKRSQLVSDISYELAIALLRGGDNFHGSVQIQFSINDSYKEDEDEIFIDYKGERILDIFVNGK